MTYRTITEYTSNNWWPRSKYGPYGEAPTGITIHHWGDRGQQFQNVINYLCRPGGNTSAHIVVEAGKVAWIIDANKAAFHAGHAVGNGTTIGIECRPEATAADYLTIAELIADIRATYGDLPLYPHKYWQATACPGVYDLGKLDRMARQSADAPVPSNASTTPPSLQKGALMALTDAQQQQLLDDVAIIKNQLIGTEQRNQAQFYADVLLDTVIPLAGERSSGNETTTPRIQFSWLEHNTNR